MTTDARPRKLLVKDVMTSPVITVGEAATFHEMAQLMQRNRVSALPVVGVDGQMVGIVSEADLLPKESPREGRSPWWWLEDRSERAKAEGVTATDVMTSSVVSIAPDQPLAGAARLMIDCSVKHLPVLDAGDQLIGIISRRDLLRTFARDDEEIRRDVVEGVLPRWMGLDSATVDVSVAGGVVRLRGGLERRSEIDILTNLVMGLDGVVDVDADLRFSFDDAHLRPSREAHVH